MEKNYFKVKKNIKKLNSDNFYTYPVLQLSYGIDLLKLYLSNSSLKTIKLNTKTVNKSR